VSRNAVDLDHLAELEEERRFLLASIRDLEREHEAGDVDDADYQTLRDGYVARAAAVLREIEDGRNRLPPPPARPWWRRAIVPAATVVVAAGLGVFVAQSAGQRLPGQTITGGQAANEVATLLAQARQELNAGDLPAAVESYRGVHDLEPENAEALTYSAWLVVLSGWQSGDQSAVEQGIEALDVASAVDPTYADPICLGAVARGGMLEPADTEGARVAAQACLDAGPPRDMVPIVEEMLAGLDASA